MGRHVARRGTGTVWPVEPAPTQPRRHPLRMALASLAVIGVGAAAISAVLVGPRNALARLPWVDPARCPSTTVFLAVSPGVSDVVTQILQPVEGHKLPGGTCLHSQVVAQDPMQTVSSSLVLPADRVPDVWIPDSSVWIPRLKAWPMRPIGALAQTPLVVATSENA